MAITHAKENRKAASSAALDCNTYSIIIFLSPNTLSPSPHGRKIEPLLNLKQKSRGGEREKAERNRERENGYASIEYNNNNNNNSTTTIDVDIPVIVSVVKCCSEAEWRNDEEEGEEEFTGVSVCSVVWGVNGDDGDDVVAWTEQYSENYSWCNSCSD